MQLQRHLPLLCGLISASLTWTAASAPPKSNPAFRARIAALETLLQHAQNDDGDLVIEGVDLRVESGGFSGKGNVVVGYATGTVLTGVDNLVMGRFHAVGGSGAIVNGNQSTANGEGAHVLAGSIATSTGALACAFGFDNRAAGEAAVSMGGQRAQANGVRTVTVAGDAARASGAQSVASAGSGLIAESDHATALAGFFSRVNSAHGTTLAGSSNLVRGAYACSIGGSECWVDAAGAVGAGKDHRIGADGRFGVVLAGFDCDVFDPHGVILGGERNRLDSSRSVIVGGYQCRTAGLESVTAGGNLNRAIGDRSVVSGGYFREAFHEFNWRAGGLFEDR